MPLQNRVTPSGDIVAVSARGMFTGNRGIIHDPATRTLLKRRWSSPAWITCACDFRGRRRDVMATRSWTELFFLDEATSFAAGHRPCFFCRRADAERFRAAWCAGNRVRRARAAEIDKVLHAERLAGRAKRLHAADGGVASLPDGTMVMSKSDSYLIVGSRPLQWSFTGYRATDASLDGALLLTPPSILRAFRAGYRPHMHPGDGTV